MSDQLIRIRKLADRNKSKVIAVSVPFGIYVSDQIFETRKGFGFNLVKDMLLTDTADQAIQTASKRAGLRFYTFTKQAREANANGTRLYFALDGHFNSSGYKFFATQLTPIVTREINASLAIPPLSASSDRPN